VLLRRPIVLLSTADSPNERRIKAAVASHATLRHLDVAFCHLCEPGVAAGTSSDNRSREEITPCLRKGLPSIVGEMIWSFGSDAVIVHLGEAVVENFEEVVQLLILLRADFPDVRFGVEGTYRIAPHLADELDRRRLFDRSDDMQMLIDLLF
jgi:hypothetical protein